MRWTAHLQTGPISYSSGIDRFLWRLMSPEEQKKVVAQLGDGVADHVEAVRGVRPVVTVDVVDEGESGCTPEKCRFPGEEKREQDR